MKRAIITRIIVWIATIAVVAAGGFAAVKVIENINNQQQQEESISYELNTDNFEGIVAYGDTIDLSLIKITKTENGVTTEIPVDPSMVTTHVDTTRVGVTTLKVNYAGKTFSVPITVKYKIQFTVGDQVLDTVYTLTASDLEKIEAPEKDGYVFTGWSTDIPEILYENMNLTANYEAIIPALSAVDATYGDLLADITLPANAAGAWQLENAEGTVGNAGKKTFDVKFVENGTNAILETAKLTVNVAKREVAINVFADFTYNGQRQEPTYTIDVEGLTVYSWLDDDKNYTDAGEYTYHFEIDDANYFGEAKGTFEIKKAVVTVKIEDRSIFTNEAIPKMNYEFVGLDGMSKELLAELIGLTIVYPESATLGEHKVGAVASNPSVILEVEEGTLKVIQATLEGIGEPKTPDGKAWTATYEDLLGDVEFAVHPNGKWVWATPDVEVGNVGKHTYLAIFYPSNPAFDTIECNVEITVIPRSMVIEIVGDTTVDYDGTAHKIPFVVKDTDGNIRSDVVVLGNTANTNAGKYTVVLSFENENYTVFVDKETNSKTKEVILTINKIDPETDFSKVIDVTWYEGLTLSALANQLSANYTWDKPNTVISSVGVQSFAVTYTPEDLVNYNKVTREITVDVARATAAINGVKESYSSVYNGQAFQFGQILPSHSEATLVFEYKNEKGEISASAINAGTYTVTITLPESAHYNEVKATTTVTIERAEVKMADSYKSATLEYGSSVSAIRLPESPYGKWSIQETELGNAGSKTFTAVFTFGEEYKNNYFAEDVTISVTVTKKKINPPQLSQTEFSYQEGINQAPTAGDLIGYKAEFPTVAENVGDYYVTITLDTLNYEWRTAKEDTYTLKYTIKPIANTEAVTQLPAVYGDVILDKIQLPAGIQGTWSLKNANGSVVGNNDTFGSATEHKFVAVFAPDATGNYIARTVDVTVAVAKKAVVITVNGSDIQKDYDGVAVTPPTASADNGANVIVLINGKAPAEVEIKNVNTYTVTYSYAGDANHLAAEQKTVVITINKATLEFNNDLAIRDENNVVVNEWAFNGQNATMPTVSLKTGFGKEFITNQEIYLEYLYSVDGQVWPDENDPANWTRWEDGALVSTFDARSASAPQKAGFYRVRARISTNANYKDAELVISEEFAFTIKKAEVSINVGDFATQKDYDGVAINIPKPVASNGADVTLTLKDKNGAIISKLVNAGTSVINAGEYTLEYSVSESENYLSANKEIKIVIEKATVTISKPVINDAGWSYGGAVRVPASVTFNQDFATRYNGEIEFKYYADAECTIPVSAPTTATGAGTYYVRAEFVGNADHNLEAANSEATAFTIQRAVIVPSIANKVYNGTYQVSGLVDNRFTVEEVNNGEGTPEGGKNVGTYTVTLKLTPDAAKNFAWNSADNANVSTTATYEITPGRNALNITSFTERWSFDKNAEIPAFNATATYGGVNIKYRLPNGTEVDTRPTNAATYTAIFTTTDANCPIIVVEREFTIDPAEAVFVGAANQIVTYNGTAYTLPTVTTLGNGALTFVVKKGDATVGDKIIKDYGTYTVIYTVEATQNYKAGTKSITVKVETATISQILAPTVDQNWTYDPDPANKIATPTFVFDQGQEFVTDYYFEYIRYNEATDTWADTWTRWDTAVPTEAGQYRVRARINNNNNYAEAGNVTYDVTEFTIKQADAEITLKEGTTATFTDVYRIDGSYSIAEIFANVVPSHNESELQFTCNGVKFEGAQNATTYTVIITLPASQNYKAAAPVEFTVTITPYKVVMADTYKEQTLTFGASISDIKLPESPYGEWSIVQTEIDRAGMGQSFTAIFTAFANYQGNVEADDVTITLNVKQAPVKVDPVADKIYNEGKIDSGIVDTDNNQFNIYEDLGGTDINPEGEFYRVILELVDPDNYDWDITGMNAERVDISGDKEEFLTIYYRIVSTGNEFVTAPTVSKVWTYNNTDGLKPEALKETCGAEAMYGDYVIDYLYPDGKYYTTAPTEAGKYTVRFTTADPNCSNVDVEIEITINPIVLTPEVVGDIVTKYYNGSKVPTPTLSGVDGYADIFTVVDNGTQNAGEQFLALTIKDKYKNNYKWNSIENNEVTLNVKYAQINKAQINLSVFTVGNWNYGQYDSATHKPNVEFINVNGVAGNVIYRVEYGATWTEWSDSVNNLVVNSYNVRVVIPENGNYEYVGTEEALQKTFTVSRAAASITGVTAGTTFETTYNGEDQKVADILGNCSVVPGASHTEATPQYSIQTVNGADTYTVTITLAQTANYEAAESIVVYIKVNPKLYVPSEHGETAVNQTQGAEYTNNILGTVQLPYTEAQKGDVGYWVLKDAEGNAIAADATFTALGAHTFKAVFVGNGNYHAPDVTITVNVGKKTINVPVLSQTEFTYQKGTNHVPTAGDLIGYAATFPETAEDAADYYVTIKLNTEFYQWKTAAADEFTLKYTINPEENKWTEGPSIEGSWEYKSEGDHTGKATALSGGVTVEYKVLGASDETYTTTLPTVPGDYVARFTANANSNYTTLASVTKEFTINPKKINAPTMVEDWSKPYSGAEIKYDGLTDSADKAFYTVTYPATSIVAKTYTVKVALNNAAENEANETTGVVYFVWNETNGTAADKSVTYTISPAEITVKVFTVPGGGWTYGEYTSSNKPTVEFNKDFSTDVAYELQYSVDGQSGWTTWSDAVADLGAKDYYVRIVITPSQNYTYVGTQEDLQKTFTVSRAAASITGVAEDDKFETTFNTSAQKVEDIIGALPYGITLGASHSEAAVFEFAWLIQQGEEFVTPDPNAIQNAGYYKVTVTLKATNNYESASTVIYITVNPKLYVPTEHGSTNVVTNKTAEYSDNILNIVALPVPNGIGKWVLKDMEGKEIAEDAAFTVLGNHTFKAVFVSDTTNYYADEVTVTVTVNKKQITAPTGLSQVENSYTGSKIEPGVVGGSGVGYEVQYPAEATNASNDFYYVTIVLNTTYYEWDASESTIKFGYKINPSVNKWETEPSIEKDWEYDPNGDHAGKATSTFGATIMYKVQGADDATYTTVLPVVPGNYTVRFTLNSGENYAPAGEDVTPVVYNFTITAKTVLAPGLETDLSTDYTGDPIPYWGLNDSEHKDFYTVVYPANPVNADTYIVTVSLNNAAENEANGTTGVVYYVWNGATGTLEEQSAPKSVDYKINKTTVSMNALPTLAGWQYAQTPNVPFLNLGGFEDDCTVTYKYYYDEDCTQEITDLTTLNAGTYYVKLVGVTTENVNLEIPELSDVLVKAIPFTISPADVNFKVEGISSTSNGWMYQNTFVANNYTWTAYYTDFNGVEHTVGGKFEFGAITFNADAAASIKVKFTLAENENADNFDISKEFVDFTLPVKFATVAKLVPKNGKFANATPYGSIETALENASDGATVWVVPFSVLPDYNELGDIHIRSDVTILQGVTLLLPYGATESDKNTYSDNVPTYKLHGYYSGCKSSSHGVSTDIINDDDFCTKHCVVKVIVANDVTIINKGTLEISGELSGGGAGDAYSGYTAGAHARLILGAGAKIENYNVIRAAGYIRELTKDNQSQVIVYGDATLYQPYVMMDYIDGSYMAGPYKTLETNEPVNPFNRFMLMNVSPKVEIKYGAKVITWVALYTGFTDNNNETKVTFIGPGGVVELFEGAYMTAKFDPDSLVTNLDIYGGAKSNALQLTVNIIVSDLDVTTEKCWFPLTYLYDVTLHSGNYVIGQNFKLMPGAKLTVESDATLNVTAKLIVYDQDAISSPNQDEGIFKDGRPVGASYLYPQTLKTGEAIGPAVFTINGTATIAVFGGKVNSTNPGAIITINTAASLYAQEIKAYTTGDCSDIIPLIGAAAPSQDVTDRYTITKNATLVNADQTTVFPTAPARYTYVDGIWRAPMITFDSDGGNETFDSITITPTMSNYPELPANPTKDGFVFVGWSYNGALVAKGDALQSIGDNHLEAVWAEASEIVKITYNDGTTEKSVNVADGKYPSVADPQKEGYKFEYWTYNGQKVTAGEALKLNESHTLEAKWTVLSYTITVTTNNATVKVNGAQVNNNGTVTIAFGTQVTVEVSYSQNSERSTTITGKSTQKTYSSPFTMPAEDVTINATSSGGCFTPDTLITLADGSQKRIEDVTYDDMLLVWNFNIGAYVTKPASTLINMGEGYFEKITLSFSDGTTINVLDVHGFFNLDENKYVFIDATNVAEYVGHRFLKVALDGNTEVTLEDYSVSMEYTTAYSILSAEHYNVIAEGILTVTPFPGIDNEAFYGCWIFEDDMTYDEEEMQKLIDKHGLYTYEELAAYGITYEQFININLAYLKVIVGEGGITLEEALTIMAAFMP